MKQNVSMRDIGRKLGVSAVTVSKALSGSEGVSEAVREKIVRTAQDLGYRYDLVAKVAKETSHDIGVLVPEHFLGEGCSFYASLCKKLIQQLTKINCYGILTILNEEEERSLKYPDVLDCKKCDGLIILGQVSKEYIGMLESVGINVPYICLDFYDEQSNADAVVSDGLYGGYKLTSHLIHKGHTAIGFVGTIKATSSIMDRYLGYYRSMLQHDLPIDPSWIIPDRDEHGGYHEYPLPKEMPTAFVSNCDQQAVSLIHRLQSLGYSVPEDVSVVGFNDFLEVTANVTPALTTFAVDQDTMAREAATMIVQKIRGGTTEKKGRVVTGGYMVYRDSVSDIASKR